MIGAEDVVFLWYMFKKFCFFELGLVCPQPDQMEGIKWAPGVPLLV